MKKYVYLLLGVAFLTTIITRFVNIAWGQPYFFHPDERNIASSISQLQIPSQLNPHFFAYGSFPIYSIFFLGVCINFVTSCHFSFTNCQVSFDQAIILSRLFSAVFSSGSLFLLYAISRKEFSQKMSLFILFLGIFCTGFIQFSHFGTFEMWTIFFSVLLCYYTIGTITKSIFQNTVILSGITGILVSIKIANLVFIPLILFYICFPLIKCLWRKQEIKKSIRLICRNTLLFFLIVSSVYFVTNPFVLLDPVEFSKSINYESSVATGVLPVFYTQEFFLTIPIIYQLFHVFPFLLNPVLTLLLPIILFLYSKYFWKKKQINAFIIVSFFAISFLPQAFLFTKWTRYMVTSLPFIFLMIPRALQEIHLYKRLEKLFCVILLATSMLFSLSYLTITFLQEDTRIQALNYANQQVPTNATILSEVYDLGIIPFNRSFPKISLFNVYDLDVDPSLQNSLTNQLSQTNYIILPSQRLLKTRLLDNIRYPRGNRFYQSLTNDLRQYEMIYETPCTIFCKIVYMGNPLFQYEQTASVFDRPVVRIYKRL